MTYTQSAPARSRRSPWILGAGLLVVVPVIAAAIAYPMLSSASSSGHSSSRGFSTLPEPSPLRSPSTAASPTDAGRAGGPAATGERRGPRGTEPGPRGDHRDEAGKRDGLLPKGTSVFDDELPGVVNLDADLLGALRQAATDAAPDGIRLYVKSGWRSPEYQDQLYREALALYGSAEEAAKWAATSDKSIHVAGGAIDIGPFEGMAWLSEHGARYGLCQIYENEPWHYELRPRAVGHHCPRMYADPAHDPRLQ